MNHERRIDVIGPWPGPVRLFCEKCGRTGQYRRQTLLARFGPKTRLPDVLADLAVCARRENCSAPCHAVYSDLVACSAGV